MYKYGYLLLFCAITFMEVSETSEMPQYHFFSLKSSEVNLRVGPGEEYPIAWVLTKSGLPLLLIAEFGNWKKVRLVDGTEGWIHMNIISKKNTAIVIPDYAIMYRYSSSSQPIAKIEKNVVVRVLKRENIWIKVEVNRIKGWVERENLWGVIPN